MITKAIVEEVISPYQVKIRVPLLDREGASPLSTSSDNLNVATICCLPNCYMNIQVGDVVFVAFEDNTYYKAVILGHLSRAAMTSTYADVHFRNLIVEDSATLPSNTCIGDVSMSDILSLKGTSENIQQQIDDIREQLNSLLDRLGGS